MQTYDHSNTVFGTRASQVNVERKWSFCQISIICNNLERSRRTQEGKRANPSNGFKVPKNRLQCLQNEICNSKISGEFMCCRSRIAVQSHFPVGIFFCFFFYYLFITDFIWQTYELGWILLCRSRTPSVNSESHINRRSCLPRGARNVVIWNSFL